MAKTALEKLVDNINKLDNDDFGRLLYSMIGVLSSEELDKLAFHCVTLIHDRHVSGVEQMPEFVEFTEEK